MEEWKGGMAFSPCGNYFFLFWFLVDVAVAGLFLEGVGSFSLVLELLSSHTLRSISCV